MITSNTIIATVIHTPTEDGALIHVHDYRASSDITADIIEPEGDGLDCWLGTKLARWVDALEEGEREIALDQLTEALHGGENTFELHADCDEG